MNKIETYSTVLIGIILGMAIARVVGFFGSVILNKHYAKVSFSHGIWLVGLLLLIVQSWWAMQTDWDFNRVDSLFKITFLLVSPILLYLASAILCPDMSNRPVSFDLMEYHESVRTVFFISLAALFIVLIPEAVIMDKCGIAWFDGDNIARLVVAILFLLAPWLIHKWKLFDLLVPGILVLILVGQLVLSGPIIEANQCKTATAPVLQTTTE